MRIHRNDEVPDRFQFSKAFLTKGRSMHEVYGLKELSLRMVPFPYEMDYFCVNKKDSGKQKYQN